MKLSIHFIEYSSQLRDYLTIELCEYAVDHYSKMEVQSDGRIKYWAFIENYNKYLRVVIDKDGETIITAFFDRDYNPTGEK